MPEDSDIPGDLPPSYTPYEVAKIAAALLAQWTFDGSQQDRILDAAVAAVALLKASDDEVRWQKYLYDLRRETRERNATLEKACATLRRKFPGGRVPWLQGLLYITQKRSEIEGIVGFRRWREFEVSSRRARQSIDGANVVLSPGVVDSFDGVEAFKSHGFRVEELPHFRLRYGSWLKAHHIPAVRRASGRAGAEARRDGRQTS